MNMKWKKGKASKGKRWVCILDGKGILEGEEFIRPHHRGGPNWNNEMVKGRGVPFKQRPPCFHLDCFKTMGNWFGGIPPVYGDDGDKPVPL
jgi:hypothetical protein